MTKVDIALMFDDGEDDFLAPAAPWAVTSKSALKSEDSKDEDIFSHRNKFDAIARDKIEYEKEKAAKVKLKQERLDKGRHEKAAKKESKTSVKRESGGAEEKGSLKKRRMNAEEGKRILALRGLATASAIDIVSSDDEPEATDSLRRSPRTSRTKNIISLRSRSEDNATIEQDDVVYDEEFEITTIPVSQAQPESPPEDEEDEDSDPEIAAMRREARERARRRHEQSKKALSPDTANTAQVPTSLPDATVQLLITSPIPDTEPLICHRKLSQSLLVVREAWCFKQKYDKATADLIFFTYRGRKLFDSTTVRRLGFSVDANGVLHREEDPNTEDDGKVHIEAVTEILFQEKKAEKERQTRLAAAPYDEPEDEPAMEETQPQNQPKLQRLIVRAKGKPDFKLKVSSTTQFRKIIKTAKKFFGFTEEQEVYVTFDDERLRPEQKIGDTEIDDMMVVDMFQSG